MQFELAIGTASAILPSLPRTLLPVKTLARVSSIKSPVKAGKVGSAQGKARQSERQKMRRHGHRHTQTHTDTRTHTHARTHTHTHIHTHTHTEIQIVTVGPRCGHTGTAAASDVAVPHPSPRRSGNKTAPDPVCERWLKCRSDEECSTCRSYRRHTERSGDSKENQKKP